MRNSKSVKQVDGWLLYFYYSRNCSRLMMINWRNFLTFLFTLLQKADIQVCTYIVYIAKWSIYFSTFSTFLAFFHFFSERWDFSFHLIFFLLHAKIFLLTIFFFYESEEENETHFCRTFFHIQPLASSIIVIDYVIDSS